MTRRRVECAVLTAFWGVHSVAPLSKRPASERVGGIQLSRTTLPAEGLDLRPRTDTRGVQPMGSRYRSALVALVAMLAIGAVAASGASAAEFTKPFPNKIEVKSSAYTEFTGKLLVLCSAHTAKG